MTWQIDLLKPQNVVPLSPSFRLQLTAGFSSVAQMCVFESVLHTEKDENHQRVSIIHPFILSCPLILSALGGRRTNGRITDEPTRGTLIRKACLFQPIRKRGVCVSHKPGNSAVPGVHQSLCANQIGIEMFLG